MIPDCDYAETGLFDVSTVFARSLCASATHGLLAYPTFLQWFFGAVFIVMSLVTLGALLAPKRSKTVLQLTRLGFSGALWLGFGLMAEDLEGGIRRDLVPPIADFIRDLTSATVFGNFAAGFLMLISACVMFAIIPAGWVAMLARLGRIVPTKKEPTTENEPSPSTNTAPELPRWGGQR